MRSVRTWFILHTAWVAAQGEFWHLHTLRLSTSWLPSNPCTLVERTGAAQPETPSRRGSPPAEADPEVVVLPPAASWGRNERRSCSQPGWMRALEPQPLLQAKLGWSCWPGIHQEFGICRAGKYYHSPTAQAKPKHGKGKCYEQEDWVTPTASGKEKELGNKAIVSTLGLLLGNWIYFGSCRARGGSTPGRAGRDAPRAGRRLAGFSHLACHQRCCVEWAGHGCDKWERWCLSD